MILGMVVGTVVCSTRADQIEAAKYLLVEHCDQHGKGKNDFHVVLDPVGAGPGEMVFVSLGSPSRNTDRTLDRPIDALILGIVDLVDENDKVVYRK